LAGKTLGHYEILEPLGKGGVGEVYRARDTTLKRDVAIKVLPAEFASDPEGLAGQNADETRACDSARQQGFAANAVGSRVPRSTLWFRSRTSKDNHHPTLASGV